VRLGRLPCHASSTGRHRTLEPFAGTRNISNSACTFLVHGVGRGKRLWAARYLPRPAAHKVTHSRACAHVSPQPLPAADAGPSEGRRSATSREPASTGWRLVHVAKRSSTTTVTVGRNSIVAVGQRCLCGSQQAWNVRVAQSPRNRAVSAEPDPGSTGLADTTSTGEAARLASAGSGQAFGSACR